ncbi:uncharacterized protein LOC119233047 isoform X3 [Talpa occidentalis]|uniref:uncharacterized protein LOC119233047 isoform X3 n=1 Tax=Talpa occidentalis TaxID=50954 RepID=UPI0023F8E8DE|nr:uncharacterized protein LOC119233047 isoform X3 [Talpa occidentalis]
MLPVLRRIIMSTTLGEMTQLQPDKIKKYKEGQNKPLDCDSGHILDKTLKNLEPAPKQMPSSSSSENPGGWQNRDRRSQRQQNMILILVSLLIPIVIPSVRRIFAKEREDQQKQKSNKESENHNDSDLQQHRQSSPLSGADKVKSGDPLATLRRLVDDLKLMDTKSSEAIAHPEDHPQLSSHSTQTDEKLKQSKFLQLDMEALSLVLDLSRDPDKKKMAHVLEVVISIATEAIAHHEDHPQQSLHLTQTGEKLKKSEVLRLDMEAIISKLDRVDDLDTEQLLETLEVNISTSIPVMKELARRLHAESGEDQEKLTSNTRKGSEKHVHRGF